MHYLVEAAEWFVGLFQEGAKTFVSWMGSIVPLAVSYTHLTLPTIAAECRSRWSPYH